MAAASRSSSRGHAASGAAAASSDSYSSTPAGAWPSGVSFITTTWRIVGQSLRIDSSTGHVLASQKITESPAWLTM